MATVRFSEKEEKIRYVWLKLYMFMCVIWGLVSLIAVQGIAKQPLGIMFFLGLGSFGMYMMYRFPYKEHGTGYLMFLIIISFLSLSCSFVQDIHFLIQNEFFYKDTKELFRYFAITFSLDAFSVLFLYYCIRLRSVNRAYQARSLRRKSKELKQAIASFAKCQNLEALNSLFSEYKDEKPEVKWTLKRIYKRKKAFITQSEK